MPSSLLRRTSLNKFIVISPPLTPVEPLKSCMFMIHAGVLIWTGCNSWILLESIIFLRQALPLPIFVLGLHQLCLNPVAAYQLLPL